MVAIEAKYHIKRLVGLYNRARKANLEGLNDNGQGNAASVSDIVVAELVLYIGETRQDEKTTPIFKLTELAQLYKSRIEQLKVKVDTRINTTRLREMILAEFPDMQSYKKGRDVLMAFEKDVGAALAKAYEQETDKAAVHIARAAQIVRRQIFGDTKAFNSFPERCQEDSVSQLLLTLMSMVLE